MNKDDDNKPNGITPSAEPFLTQPENTYEQVNKYGTYEIQPTAESGNEYPAIAQGMSQKKRKKLKIERDKWLETDKRKYTL